MQQALCFPQLLILLIVYSSQVSVIPWSYMNQTRQQSLPNRLPTKAAMESGIVHYAFIQSISEPRTALFGGMATFDVYGLQIPYTQASSAQICVVNNQGDDFTVENAAVAGWIVTPAGYGDNKTHFFTLWTVDGYKSTGCSNLECNGFVPVQNAPITPGDPLDIDGQKINITIKIFKNKDDGDWWLYFGYDNSNLSAVRYWPKSIFTSMADHANSIQWGGSTYSDPGSASPVMGNGHWPGIDSATVRDVRFVDGSGRGYKIGQWPEDLHPYMSHEKCYGAVLSVDEMFYYGGPGGCTM